MHSPRDIAVVIPCYNHASVLRRTIRGLERQTIKPTEVVVVDDGSIDHPEKILRQAQDDGGLQVAFVNLDKNYGAPYARNTGAKITKSPYILFLDADAELVPDALETMVKTLENHPEADFAYSSFIWGWKKFPGRDFDTSALQQTNYIHTSSLLRRSAFPGFDESLKKFQDWDLWLTMAKRGSKGIWIDRYLYRIDPWGGKMSGWLPSIAYRIPWKKIGWEPKRITRYREAEAVIRQKHGL
jgi:glycosyltransferase involved in cell wall biosynthesis